MSFISDQAMQVMPPEDRSCLDEAYGDEEWVATPVLLDLYIAEEPLFGAGYASPWWGSQLGMNLGDTGISDIQQAAWFGLPWPVSGCNGRLSFVGVTRDQYGSPIANCTVRCYLVSTGELISRVFSDTNGAFTITSPYSAPHFLTTHSTGVAGATLDTLTPS